ncbi:MAG: DUF4386 domain-containing protein [Promethearchaeota archaeon]
MSNQMTESNHSERMRLTATNSELSPVKLAKAAGIAYFLMIINAIFAQYFVRETLIIPGNAIKTATNITDSEMLFRMAVAAYLIILTLDVLLAWLFYILFKPVNKDLALLSSIFRLIYSAINGINQVFFLLALEVLGDADYMTALGPGQSQALAMTFLNIAEYGFIIGLTFFGFHLAILGYIVLKSDYFPKIIGIGVIVAGIGYILDNYTTIIFADNAEIISMILMLPMVIREAGFALWLLIKGIKASEL